jgi:hypothetical protein
MADKGKGKPRSSMRGARQLDDGFDASPNAPDLPAVSDGGSRFGNGKKGGPKNIQETKAWKESVGGVQRFWGNYVNTLKTAFKRMDRRQQEDLITRVSQIITVGTAIITMSAWYWFMPQQIRVIALPIVIVGSWWVGTKIVGPSMIARFDSHLHPEE